SFEVFLLPGNWLPNATCRQADPQLSRAVGGTAFVADGGAGRRLAHGSTHDLNVTVVNTNYAARLQSEQAAGSRGNPNPVHLPPRAQQISEAAQKRAGSALMSHCRRHVASTPRIPFVAFPYARPRETSVR